MSDLASNKKFWAVVGILVLVGLFFVSRGSKTPVNFPSKGVDYIAFGDSLVSGVGSTKGNDFVSQLERKINKPIINLGVSGNTTSQGLSRVKLVDQYKPNTIFLLLGGNDYLQKIPIDETFDNLEKIIASFQARGAVVVLLGVRGGILTDKFDQRFEELAKKRGVVYVPNVLAGLLGDMRYMSDAIHPNDLGYQMISEKVYKEAKDYIK